MLSLIIPTLNASDSLPDLIGSRPKDVDLVISDGGSADETLTIALKAGARLALGGRGRGRQLRLGARRAQGDWLLFLHADSRLTANWRGKVDDHIRKNPDCAGYFDFKLNSSHPMAPVIEVGVRWRCRLFGLPYGDQGLLISRELYDAIGGYPDWPLFEDVKLAEKLGRRRLKRLGAPLVTSAEKYERQGWLRRPLKNLWLLLRYKFGASPEALAGGYR